MSVKSLLLIMLGGILANNYALEKLLGITPFLGFSKKGGKTLGMGLAVAIVMLLSAAVTWPLQTFVLDRFGLGSLQTFLFVAVILALVYCADAVARRAGKGGLGGYFPLIVLNSAVLGLCVNNAAGGIGFAESLFAALGAGLGFLLGMEVFSALRTKINDAYVPAAFRGLPITVLAAFIFSMVLVAFK